MIIYGVFHVTFKNKIKNKHMKKKILYITIGSVIFSLSFFMLFRFELFLKPKADNVKINNNIQDLKSILTDTIQIINQTFLGNYEHNFYGDSAPDHLNIIWKKNLGSGTTIVGSETKTWSGAGWTGQPLMVKEKNKKYIIQGSYSHKLRKIDAENGNFIWEYKFDDVLKGTGSIWRNKNAKTIEDKYVVIQGSRKGNDKNASSKTVPSLRAVSYFTGKELWRYNSKKTKCYSRDVDGSAIFLNDTAFIGLENGKLLVFNPDYKHADTLEGILQPEIFEEHQIYDENDIILHGGNLVMEASLTKLKHRIYIATGAGHVYGYNLKTHTIDWDFFIGSDIDGTPVVTHDSCLLVAIEKEYIKGQGGVFKLNPDKDPDNCVEWFYPLPNKGFHTWAGGVIGSATVNKHYNGSGIYINIAAFTGIDGFLYIINTDSVTNETVLGPNLNKVYATPQLIYKYETGPAISTPVIVQNKIIAAGYRGIYLFSFDEHMKFKLLDKFETTFEATPFVDNGRIYIASRDGFLYCFGTKSNAIE
jgi:outer membrane protein assembly factor BamB